jgi:hypothetical protein
MGDEEKQDAVLDDGYTAFQKWEYKPFIYVDKQAKPWISFKESFYRASEVIIKNLAKGRGFPELEGVAAVFLFRHYLELALKTLVMRGRFLERADKNAAIENVKQVKRIHDLAELWQLVLKEAKPKIEPKDWDSYDIAFVERCIAEFHERDEKGFALRYHGEGGEHFDYDFAYFAAAMEHVYQVLEGLTVYLIETYGQNEEWQEILNSY